MKLADELEQLQSLHLSGLLTADEYERAKSRLIDRESAPEPDPVDWGAVAEEPASATRPPRRAEVTERDLWRALETGFVGGGVLGLSFSLTARLAARLAASAASSPTVIVAALVGALVGAVVWTVLSLGVKAGPSRGLVAALLHVFYGIAVLAYAVAAVILVGVVIYVKTLQQPPAPVQYIPPASVR